ncbi:MAG TPA: DUF2528 family protein [Pseudomonas sabulinigri]|uniref:DUF2528 family protein n=1 Tax=marine sediment metagenome TaxID=412755 RepID=A0A0F9VFW5_9ZZZZ|nr:DUF2528 family protein [Halopseudomonas sabulinigri]HEC51752.1 DUF2528 family protein [Halopseudomonas sabulinigri]
MQATQPNSGTPQATTDSNIKRYRVSEDFRDYSVMFEVDHGVLTPQFAQQINEFWTDHENRADEEEGDHVRAVIRMAGHLVIGLMLQSGWDVDFAIGQLDQGKHWSEKFRDEEGWGAENGNPYGRCGIRIIAATVEQAGFESLSLEEVINE